MPNLKTAVASPDAPAAIGPYSPAVSLGQLVFISGQIPLDPVSGDLVSGDIQEQARRVMENLGALLKAAGLGFDDVVKTTIYLTDLSKFAEVNTVYGGYFGAIAPARATVQVAGLPKGALVEIDAVAMRSG